MLQIVGLGAGDLKLVTLEVYQALKDAEQIYLRTEFHPAVQGLKEEGIEFKSFDYLYEGADEFQEIYQQIANQISSLSNKGEKIVYAVPGHPLVAESSVQQIIKQVDKSHYQILAGPSFLDTVFARLNLDPIDGVKIIDALNFTSRDLDPTVDTIISQVYNRATASEVKLNLMEIYPDEFSIQVLQAVGLEDERIEEIPLYMLDRLDWIDHLTSVYVSADKQNPRQFSRLVEIMEILRSNEGCPWDQEQDYQSLKKYLIEETYEVVERIEEEDYFGLAEELGDLLLQVVFQSQIATEEGKFTVRDVISEIVEKMVRRHPHVFEGIEVKDADEVMINWKQIKEEEKEETDNYLLDSVAVQLPALIQAQQIQEKVAEVGFDWPEISGVLEKVTEELGEFKTALAKEDIEHIKEEFGDLIFSLVNVARFIEIDAETSLRLTIQKFRRRFACIEDKVTIEDRELDKLSLEELDVYWEETKQNIRREDDA
ncbi:nucleoside triphosphate pyrophosphohydrolase [Halanaerocella petrolearia]